MKEKYADDYIFDYENDTVTDVETGETTEIVHACLAPGATILTAAWKRRNKERKEKEAKAALRMSHWKKFVLVNAEHNYNDIKPETVGRLMYLCTLLQYGKDIIFKNKETLKKNDLQKILGLPESTFRRFWFDVKDKYIFEDKDKVLHIKGNFFIRGSLKGHYGIEWQKAFIKDLRALYFSIPNTKHRYLGYIFQMLPYINKEYNILCHNPDETELEDIEPITLDEFCELCGYSADNKKRLVKEYLQITFKVRKHKESFCSFVWNSIETGKGRIFVNPNIIYKGSKQKEVSILGEFCKY